MKSKEDLRGEIRRRKKRKLKELRSQKKKERPKEGRKEKEYPWQKDMGLKLKEEKK